MFKFSIIVFQILLLSCSAFAADDLQQSKIWDKMLVLKLPPENRRGIVPKDPLEEMLVTGKWLAPQAGDSIQFNDTLSGSWQTLTADSNGYFSGEILLGAYAWLQINSDSEQTVMLDAMTHQMVYVNGVPRVGNSYQYKDSYQSWEPAFDFAQIPIRLKKGLNELLFKCNRGMLRVKTVPMQKSVFFNPRDITLPDFVIGEKTQADASIVVINSEIYRKKNLAIITSLDGASEVRTELPFLPAVSLRKMAFQIWGGIYHEKTKLPLKLKLLSGSEVLDTVTLQIDIKNSHETRRRTFTSKIDSSVQYYAVNPSSGNPEKPQALFLSLHGANVKADNQANAYYAKNWGHIVAPTNRRPFGYNWEDWGRLDALEVYDLAMKSLNIDPSRIYLTGHSMGGHGSWIFGATYPDKFAAIAPSAGWISFWSYRARTGDMDGQYSPMENMFRRAALPSRTMRLKENYRDLGIYAIHGADDKNVPASEMRLMMDSLKTFHKNYDYHEEPSAGHWWDKNPERGADCVDWAPMFDFFAGQARPEKSRKLDITFSTANPGISAWNYWVGIERQIKPLLLSTVTARVDKGIRKFTVETQNVELLGLDLSVLAGTDSVTVVLDSQQVAKFPKAVEEKIARFELKNGKWTRAFDNNLFMKGPHRAGMFKDAFRNQMIFVVGTNGSDAENAWAMSKAKFDAECLWYQGNGSIEIVTDKEFDVKFEPDRNVILYGNSQTNKAWKKVLRDCPVEVKKGMVKIGDRQIKGKNLACLFIYPRQGSDIASVGVVSGSGLSGMKLTNIRRYLYAAQGFPDLMLFDTDVFKTGTTGVKAAGFFGNDWRVASGDFVWVE